MAYQITRLTSNARRGMLSEQELADALEHLNAVARPRYRRLWAYYRNPLRPVATEQLTYGTSERPYRQGQEWGLPSRITGQRGGREPFAAEPVDGIARKEVVIENDIAWRVDTAVEYLFGKPIVLKSAAADPQRRALLDRLVRAILAYNGGILFLQQMALLGAVYGFVDVLVKFNDGIDSINRDSTSSTSAAPCATQDLGEPPVDANPSKATDQNKSTPGGDVADSGDAGPVEPDGSADGSAAPVSGSDSGAGDQDPLEALVQRLACKIRLEIVEPQRALPLLSPSDWRIVDAYAQVYEAKPSRPAHRNGRGAGGGARGRWWERLFRSARGLEERLGMRPAKQCAQHIELITADRWQRYEDETLIHEGTNSLGQLPLVHIQNTAVPFEYAGASDVEPLIPLQDELNTRLSDRANRIALQSFKMYLGIGIEHFNDLPVAPGRMWMTDNEQAEVKEFGGDVECPSETAHIADLREALDKISGVSPIAAGAIKGRIGRLTSAAALRVTLISLLAKTEKKRTTYGSGLARMIELALLWLDKAGLLHTSSDERRVEIHWPSPLPANDLEKLQEAEIKARLGLPREVVLGELGY